MINGRSRKVLVATLLLVAFSLKSSPGMAAERAMVFSGKNINTALFLGMFDGAAAAGKPVDLVIGACGGAIGAALVHVESDREKRLGFLKSRDYYTMAKNVGLSDKSIFYFLQVLARQRKAAKMNIGGSANRMILTDWYRFSMVEPTTAMKTIPEFDVPFVETQTPVILVAGRALFQAPARDQVVSATTKLFKEVYFTDPTTALLLKDLPSYTGTEFPNSAVASDTEVRTPKSLIQAVLASIGDPIYIGPAHFNQQYYFTGAIDLHPTDLARRLAREVITTYPSSFEPSIEAPLMEAAYGYDPNEYIRRVIATGTDFWIDMSDALFPNFSPNKKWHPMALAKLDPGHAITIGSNIPDNYADYVLKVQQQYDYGFERTVEALGKRRRSLTHIRKPILQKKSS
jgi:hypothetical protein